jgi:hypothetical protein
MGRNKERIHMDISGTGIKEGIKSCLDKLRQQKEAL